MALPKLAILTRAYLKYVAIFFVVLLIVGSLFAIDVTKNMLAQKQRSSNDMDFFMRDVVYTQIAEDGTMQSQVRSPYIEHYPLTDMYFFNLPQMTILDASKNFWEITADKGNSNKDGQEVKLQNNVKIVQKTNSVGQGLMTVTTSAATIYPQRKKAYTDQPLVINEGGTIVKAVGADVDFQSATLKLLSKVQGQYVSEDGK